MPIRQICWETEQILVLGQVFTPLGAHPLLVRISLEYTIVITFQWMHCSWSTIMHVHSYFYNHRAHCKMSFTLQEVQRLSESAYQSSQNYLTNYVMTFHRIIFWFDHSLDRFHFIRSVLKLTTLLLIQCISQRKGTLSYSVLLDILLKTPSDLTFDYFGKYPDPLNSYFPSSALLLTMKWLQQCRLPLVKSISWYW